mmetsp:Transcript_66567/g.74571  ORF Transcript_66567/g.74571 Transcript_66567/m.74571 type:complete len:669 (-) Transcript_66567:176-2182(-)
MNRFKWWAMLVFSSLLVWVSICLSYYWPENSINRSETIVLGCLSIIIILAVGGLLSTMCTEGKKKVFIETVFILLNLVVWTILAVSVLIDISFTSVPLVVDSYEDNRITNPNYCFFTFGGLFIVVYLVSSWFKQYVLLDENALTSTQWMFLASSNFLVMVSGFSMHRKECKNTATCSQIVFGIVLGLISGIMSSVIIPWRSAPLKCQAEIALILLVTWTFAIVILTFNGGPAVTINPMYFGIYLSFFLSLNILTTANYADSMLELSPCGVEFGAVDSGSRNLRGAAGFLDMAYTNLTSPQPVNLDDDPRNNESQTMLFESVGGSFSSIIPQNQPVASELNGTTFNKIVLVGRRNLSRIEIWFFLMIESIICAATFYPSVNQEEVIYVQWIFAMPCLSICICFMGWFIGSVQKTWAYVVEGILIIPLIILWIIDLMSVCRYFRENAAEEKYPFLSITANQLFASFGAFFTSLFLFTKWSNASITTTDWLFLCATTGCIFLSVTIAYTDGNVLTCEAIGDIGCKVIQGTKLLGAGSALTSFVMVLVSFFPAGRLLAFVHFIFGAALLVLWCVGAYYIVFNHNGIGTNPDPIFFACWGSLFICVDVTTTHLVLLCTIQSVEDELAEDEEELFEYEDATQIRNTDANDQNPEQVQESNSSSESNADFDAHML